MDLSNMVPASPQPSMHHINGYLDRASPRYASTRSEASSFAQEQQDQQHIFQVPLLLLWTAPTVSRGG
jgi:hypothetical protein